MAHGVVALTFDSGGLIGSCFFYGVAGIIAGTVASFVARGRLGCLVGNFFLGIAGAIVGKFLFDLASGHIPGVAHLLPDKTGFLGTTIIASVVATALALLITTALRVERRHQQRLLDRAKKAD